MAEFGDSLTIRILADSSELQSELSRVIDAFDDLRERIEDIGGLQQQLGRLGTALTAASAPLQQLTRLFDQLRSRVEALSQTSVTLNTGPAHAALQALSEAIARIQAQLQSLSMPIGAPLPLPIPGFGGPIRQFAAGGFVEGPSGTDRVPALLTAGEFVLNQDAVRQVGLPFLQQINAAPQTLRLPSSSGEAAQSPASITTQFGGVTIQLQQPSELGAVLDALQLEELRQRTRRG